VDTHGFVHHPRISTYMTRWPSGLWRCVRDFGSFWRRLQSQSQERVFIKPDGGVGSSFISCLYILDTFSKSCSVLIQYVWDLGLPAYDP